MNKYQEALERARICGDRDCSNCKFNEICINDKKGWYGTLKELVDKATPKKPKRNVACDKTNFYYCSKCNTDVYIGMKYCCECGQALDWSD